MIKPKLEYDSVFSIASDSAWKRNLQIMAERNNTTDEYIHSSTCWNIKVKNPNYKCRKIAI